MTVERPEAAVSLVLLSALGVVVLAGMVVRWLFVN